jgi:succinate dehydrogenase/fumarate reductase flavoprotein subunit
MDEVDVVVVGAGTGMLAAITAAEEGLEVLVVEKAEHVGGSTALSGGGFWIPGNSILTENGQREDPERVRTYLRAATKGEVADERWQSHIDHGPAAVEVLRRRTPLRFQFMSQYADYFPELPGGSATGRACEPKPFDLRRLGGDRSLLLPPVMAAPFPMPITGKGYKWTNLVARTPKGLASTAIAVGQGVGGAVIRREYAAGGQALAAGLLAGLRSMEIPVWTSSPLKDLVVEDGRVVGVVVVAAGKDITVRARKGVILSSGGFDRSPEMRRAYQSDAIDGSWSLGTTADTGEVIRLAESHGADLAFMDAAWWFPSIPLPGGQLGVMLAERSLPGQIIVNGHGRRFMDEAVNYMTAGQIIIGKHTAQDPHIPAWIVFDQRYRNRYLFGAGLFPRQPLPQSWYDAGIAKKGDTITALADALAMPELPATVDRFNLLANAGRDDDFGRGDSAYDRYYGDPTISPNPCLGPIDKGPFYAVQVVPGDLGTCGGVRADRYARALRADGSVIEGLYATGNAAGNAFGRVYPGPGATVGQGLTFGYVAARHLAGRLGVGG